MLPAPILAPKFGHRDGARPHGPPCQAGHVGEGRGADFRPDLARDLRLRGQCRRDLPRTARRSHPGWEVDMAQKVTVALVDDLDGGPADETVRFGLDGAAM